MPHYDLPRVQAQVARMGAAAFTKTALDGGRNMGLTTAEMLAVVASLSRRDFHKSMTTYTRWSKFRLVARRRADPRHREPRSGVAIQALLSAGLLRPRWRSRSQ